MTLPGAAPNGDDSRQDLHASLEEILKPFAGLSQLLGAYHEFKTMEDLNRMISKAADEFEAMREDKLNDGRPIGPLQVIPFSIFPGLWCTQCCCDVWI